MAYGSIKNASERGRAEAKTKKGHFSPKLCVILCHSMDQYEINFIIYEVSIIDVNVGLSICGSDRRLLVKNQLRKCGY